MWRERLRLWRYMEEPADNGGGGEPTPPTPEPTPEPTPPADDGLAAGKQAYVNRLKELGGQFDSAGNFLGFAAPEPQRTVPQNQPTPEPYNYNMNTNDDLDAKFTQLKEDIVSEIMPEKVAGGFTRVLSDHPELKRYEKEARSAIDAMGSASVNDQQILSMLYFIRGQAADMEIAEAVTTERKKITEGTNKVEAGQVPAGSQTGSSTPPSTPANTPKVDDLTADLAAGWGLDPAEMQKKLNERKGAK